MALSAHRDASEENKYCGVTGFGEWLSDVDGETVVKTMTAQPMVAVAGQYLPLDRVSELSKYLPIMTPSLIRVFLAYAPRPDVRNMLTKVGSS